MRGDGLSLGGARWTGTHVSHGLLVVLAFAAGATDAIGFLALGQVFTANMTGNAVLFGIALGQGTFDAAWRSATALGGFVLGAALATAMTETSPRGNADSWPRRVALAIAVECGVLGGLAILWAVAGEQRAEAFTYGLIALASCAMGIQAGAVRRLHVPDVLTVVITSTLTGLVARLTEQAAHPHRRPPAEGGATLDVRTGAVAAVALGAVAAGAVELRAYAAAALVPLAAACSVAAVTALRRAALA